MKLTKIARLVAVAGLVASGASSVVQSQQAHAQVNCYRNNAGICIACPSGTTANGAGGCRPKTTTPPTSPDPLRLKEEQKKHAQKVANQQKDRGKQTQDDTQEQVDNDDGQGTSAPATTSVSSYPGASVSGPRPPFAAPPAGVKKIEPKKGNIKVVTYIDQERVDSKGNRDKRLGLVKINVERVDEGKSAKCSNRKKPGAITNGKREIKKIVDGKEKKLLVKGTANWRNCNAGKYKITAVGREGYTVKGDKSIEVNLEDDENEVVKFVLTKNKTENKKKSSTKKTSQILYTNTNTRQS